MNQKRWIIGVVVAVALVCLALGVVGIQWWRKSHQATVQQRTLVLKLAYCNSNNARPCIESFSVDAEGKMLVNLLTPASAYPDFYLTISNASTTNRYDCQQVEDFPTNVYCTGAEMYPGEALQFKLIAIEDDAVLAEGSFAIIGLLLPNPAEETTETPAFTESPIATTEAPFESPTPFMIETFTPIPDTTVTPSYPNPTAYP